MPVLFGVVEMIIFSIAITGRVQRINTIYASPNSLFTRAIIVSDLASYLEG